MNRRISPAELSSLLAARADMPLAEAERFVAQFFTVLSNGLVHEKLVKVRGLGTFKVIDVSSRTSVNVNTGQRYEIASHAKVSYTPDSSLRDTINSPFASFETVVINEGTDISKLEATTVDTTAEEMDTPAEEPATVPETSTQENEEPIEQEEQTTEQEIQPSATEEQQQELEPEQQQELEPEQQEEQQEEQNQEMSTSDTYQTKEQTAATQEFCHNQGKPASKWKQFFPYCATAIVMLIVGYCIGYYMHPMQLPTFLSEEESAIILAYRQYQQAEADRAAQIQKQQEALDKHQKEEAEKQARVEQACNEIMAEEGVATSNDDKASTGNDKPASRVPSEALAYPQIEDGEYYIVGIRDTVIVKPGMTLLNMAIKYYKDKDLYIYICKLSGVDDPNRVHPDQKLLIPELKKKEQ